MHVSSRTVGLEQYYTNDALAERLTAIAMDMDETGDALFLEPSVGRGAVYDKLPHDRRLGVELCEDDEWRSTPEPDPNLLLGRDFLKFDLPPEHRDRAVIVVGNPPFGGDAQIRFLNRAAELECSSLTVIFVLGLSMRKWSNLFRVHERLHLIDERIVPRDASHFLDRGKKVTVPTVVQTWTRRDHPRTSDPKLLRKNHLFDVVGCADWRRANVVLKRFASPACLGEVGVVGEDVVLRPEGEGKQVTAYYVGQKERKRFGTVVGKSGAQGTVMLIAARDVHAVARRLRKLWGGGEGAFREYARDTTSNVGNGVCVNREEVFTLYEDPKSITRERKYLTMEGGE